MSALRISAALLTAALAVGCLGQAAPQKQRYVLNVKPVQAQDPGERGVVQVNRVSVAPLFERKGIVYRTGDDRYEAAFYHEFYSPPGELIREAMARWLWHSNVFTDVVTPVMRKDPDWWLEGRVNKLYADVRRADAPEAVLEMVWVLIDARSTDLPVVFEKSYSSIVALKDREPATVVDGLRRAFVQEFTKLNDDMARAIDALEASVEEEDVRP